MKPEGCRFNPDLVGTAPATSSTVKILIDIVQSGFFIDFDVENK